MLAEVRDALEKTTKIESIKSRATGLDACLSWIAGELDGCDLDAQELKLIDNIRKAHCREFVSLLTTYGNSGYEEAGPLSELFVNHINIFVELDKENPKLLEIIRPFFRCIG